MRYKLAFKGIDWSHLSNETFFKNFKCDCHHKSKRNFPNYFKVNKLNHYLLDLWLMHFSDCILKYSNFLVQGFKIFKEGNSYSRNAYGFHNRNSTLSQLWHWISFNNPIKIYTTI